MIRPCQQGFKIGPLFAPRKLLLDIGGAVYDSDSYADDLPYFIGKHLIIPYTLDCNDFHYTTSPGFTSPTDFFQHLK
ncbi:hypothetical protein [Legionella israelensis]|uniref:hypothetical protein n=1 Tax=Legionella israelensis TaxID=454 RepID=UPI00163DB198|nr:hypothetical protein [Legionella israelensis]